jgi:tRNA (guanine26-N2/guanine27-N2)-dimethyltransferase
MIDFYVRVFVRVGTSGAEAQRNVSHIGHVWQCPSCHYHVTQPLATRHKNNDQKYLVSNGTPVPQNCPFCAAHFKMAGPMWLGPLHDVGVVTDLMGAVETRKFASEKKLLGILSVASEELNDVPLFYNLSDLCNVLRSTLPSMHTFKSALINAGYRVSGIHTEPFGFKTDAPMEVIWDVLRCWKKKSGQGKPPKETTPAFRILNVEPKLEADFTLVEEAKTSKKRPRFVKVDGWGPQKRAVTGGAVANTKKSKTKEVEEAAESEKNNNNNNNGDNQDADNKVKKSD